MFNSRNNQYSSLNKISKEDALKIVEKIEPAELIEIMELNNRENIIGFINNACTRSMLITLIIKSSLSPEKINKYTLQRKLGIPINDDTPSPAQPEKIKA